MLPQDHRLFLKIKLINLTDEARLIRKMERKHPHLRNDLHNHRTGVVRIESYHTLLAYGFIRGRALNQVGVGKTPPDWKKVESMVRKYAPKTLPHFRDWITP